MPPSSATFEPQPRSIPGDRLLGGIPTTEPPPANYRQIRNKANIPLNFELELERYCLARSFPPPTYCVTEVKGQRYRVTVKVSDAEYGGVRDFESVDLARENATLVALASIGLAALTKEVAGKVGQRMKNQWFSRMVEPEYLWCNL